MWFFIYRTCILVLVRRSIMSVSVLTLITAVFSNHFHLSQIRIRPSQEPGGQERRGRRGGGGLHRRRRKDAQEIEEVSSAKSSAAAAASATPEPLGGGVERSDPVRSDAARCSPDRHHRPHVVRGAGDADGRPKGDGSITRLRNLCLVKFLFIYTQYVLCGTGYVGRYQNSGLSNGTLDINFLR